MASTTAPAPRLDTAQAFASANVPMISPDDTVEDVWRVLAGRRYEAADDLAVLVGDRLVGIVRIEDLLAAPPGTRVEALMDADPPAVAPGSDREAVAWKAVQHGEGSLAVVDDAGRFVGLIPPWRMLGVLLAEHDEDMARFGGYLRHNDEARTASEEPIARRFVHRTPWLVLGLAAAMLAAWVIARFEADLERNVELAFFLPGVVYMADAVGTQTETLVVRGLSVGVPISAVVRRELVTGAAIGILIALLTLPIVWVGWGDAAVGAVVALTMLAACSTATLVAMVLPAALDRGGVDPAFGSGPLATVLQDLLSIVIYFLIASAIVSS